MFLRFLNVTACISTSFPLMDEYYSSMLQHVSVLPSFLWMNNIPLYGYTTFSLLIHQLMDIWVVSTFWLLWTMLLWIFTYHYLFEHVFVSFEFIPRRRVNCTIVILCITVWGNAELFSKGAAPFYIPTNSARVFPFLHTLSSIYCF